MHGIQNTPVNRLQTITGIGQGTRHDHTHGIIQIRRAHLGVNIHGFDISSDHILFSHKKSLYFLEPKIQKMPSKVA
jgi:hypothetical protein